MRLVNLMSTLSLERSFNLRLFRDEIQNCGSRPTLIANMMAMVQLMQYRLQTATEIAGVHFEEECHTLGTIWIAIPCHSTLEGLQEYCSQAIEQILMIEQRMVNALCSKIGEDLKV